MREAGHGHRTTHLYVDAHVHIYRCMCLDALLDAAARNLFAGCTSAADSHGVLLVADPDGVDGYARLAATAFAGDWRRLHSGRESVTFRRSDGALLTAWSGRQLVSREGLEVLAAGCAAPVASGLPLLPLVERVRAAGGLAIVAWGVGKWLGRRGRVVDALIAREADAADVMLADNAGRPRLWSRVPQFAAAAASGMPILAGSDPLPLRGEELRVGTYGVRVRSAAPADAAGDALRQALVSRAPVDIVGRQVSARDFFARQLRLRMSRRAGPGEAA